MSLSERRAKFVYEGCRLGAVAAKAPVIPLNWHLREAAFRQQFIEIIERQCGPDRLTSAKEVHDSWMQAYYDMGWVYGDEYNRSSKQHPDLVPYEELGRVEREKDDIFIALCEIARLWIYDD